MAKAKKEQEPVIEEQTFGYTVLPLARVIADPNQPRKEFDHTYILELAESIKKQGVLQPILVRPSDVTIHLPEEHAGMAYRIVCGECRFRASLEAELDTIPVIIRELTDDEAFEIAITENLQRKNINVMEESDAFQVLIQKGLSTAELIADKLGVSTKYIYDRMALQRVIPDVQQHIRTGSLTITHGKQFARLNKADQESLWKAQFIDNIENLSVSQLKYAIKSSFSLELSKAPFALDDAKLIKKAGACLQCSKRSGCNLQLFDDIQDKDICFDKQCYKEKVDAFIEKQIAGYKKKGIILQKLSSTYQNVTRSGILAYNYWNEVIEDSPDYDATETFGIICEVPAYSQSKWKLGDVIKIEIETDDDEEDEDDDDETENNQLGTGINNLLAQKIDWNDELCNTMFNEIIIRFNNGDFPGPDINKIITLFAEKEFGLLSDDAATKIAEEFGWEIIKTRWSGVDNIATIRKALATSELPLYQLVRLFTTFNAVDIGFTDADEIRQATAELAAIDLDFKSIVSQVEERAGEQLVDFDLLTQVEEE